MPRHDRRTPQQLRPLKLERNWLKYPPGSCLISMGETIVLCTASFEEKVPPYVPKGLGWLHAEYNMLPAASSGFGRKPRERGRMEVSGRTLEIGRVIGRSLRLVTDLAKLGERTVVIDCDVLSADGGTRTAAITGGFIALHDACSWLKKREMIDAFPITNFMAATSVGIVKGEMLLDLCYVEDKDADVDLNLVMTGNGMLVEMGATSEGKEFDRDTLNAMLDLGWSGIEKIIKDQKRCLLGQGSEKKG